MRETMTPGFLLSAAHLEDPLLQRAHIHHLTPVKWTQPTHGAQQQQHAAHNNGHHDGQLAAAQLHFGDDVAKVAHLYLQREQDK